MVKLLVDFVTIIRFTYVSKNNNRLYLMISTENRSSLIDRCVPLPGVSDHDVVLVDSSVLPARKKPVRRKVYLWKRANKQAMEEDLTKFTEKFTKDFSTSTPMNMLFQAEMHREYRYLCSFKDDVDSIQSSMVQPRHSLPLKKEENGLQESRATKKQSDWHRYKKIQKEA